MKLAIYFLTAYIIICMVIPFVMTLVKKLFYYIRIKRICKKYNYTVVSSILKWLFSSVRNNNPEMFIKTDEAIYSIKNFGFYKTPNYFVFHDKNNIEIQIIRMFFWTGFAFLKNLKIKSINYNNANEYFGETDLPVINVILFCPKSTGLAKLQGSSAAYGEYVNANYAFKIFGKTILKVKSIQVNPYVGFTKYSPIHQVDGAKAVELSNGHMLYSAYIYNIKSFIKGRLNYSDMLVNSVIEEERRKFETRNSYRI